MPATEIDELDKKIISILQEDARSPFRKIAKETGVSEGTIRNRTLRLINNGILKMQAKIDPFALPNKISAVVGVNLKERKHGKMMKEIAKLPFVNCVWNATGRFDLFFEVMVDSLEELNKILYANDLREFRGFKYTETFITLSSIGKYFRLSNQTIDSH